jgi:SAM-dependent methyltransferase
MTGSPKHRASSQRLPYSRAYYSTFVDTSQPSAQRIVPWLLEQFPVGSVVDVGCGDGSWLRPFMDRGVVRVVGVDGDWVSRDQLCIPAECFISAFLEAPLPALGQFDMALNLEVAEHLSPGRAGSLVADLCQLAPLIVFSAAIPGQGGAHHVNEQWPAYWCRLFHEHGYQAFDALRPRFWDDAKVSWCYKQNMILFASDVAQRRWASLAAMGPAASPAPLALVHPERWELTRGGIGYWLGAGLPALRRTLHRRLGWGSRAS